VEVAATAAADGARAGPRQAAKDEDEAAQRGKGGGSDRNPKLWCHVTQNVEIEGEQNSHWRDRRREPLRERAQPQDL